MPGSARKQQLIETAARLFSRCGFGGTTTHAIAEKAGVTEAVIFQHFKTKEELYAAIIDFKAREAGAAQWIQEMRQHATNGDDMLVVRTFVDGVLAQGRDNPEFLRLMLHSALERHDLFRHFRAKQIRPIYEFLLEYIQQRQRSGVFRPGEPATLARAFVAVPSHYVLQMLLFQTACNSDLHRAAEDLTHFILSGLRGSSSTTQAE